MNVTTFACLGTAVSGTRPAVPDGGESRCAEGLRDFSVVLSTLMGAVPVPQLANAGLPPAAEGVSQEAETRAVAPDVLDADASLDDLDPELRCRVERVIERLSQEHGHEARVTEGVRSPQRQEWLYAQGRTRPGPVVTWTRRSLHSEGRAVDVQVDGTWRNGEAYDHLQRVAREEGLRSLGPRDPGHLELPGADADHGAETGSLEAPVWSLPETVAPQQPSAHGSGVARVARVATPAAVSRVAQVARPGQPTGGPAGREAEGPDSAREDQGGGPGGPDTSVREVAATLGNTLPEVAPSSLDVSAQSAASGESSSTESVRRESAHREPVTALVEGPSSQRGDVRIGDHSRVERIRTGALAAPAAETSGMAAASTGFRGAPVRGATGMEFPRRSPAHVFPGVDASPFDTVTTVASAAPVVTQDGVPSSPGAEDRRTSIAGGTSGHRADGPESAFSSSTSTGRALERDRPASAPFGEGRRPREREESRVPEATSVNLAAGSSRGPTPGAESHTPPQGAAQRTDRVQAGAPAIVLSAAEGVARVMDAQELALKVQPSRLSIRMDGAAGPVQRVRLAMNPRQVHVDLEVEGPGLMRDLRGRSADLSWAMETLGRELGTVSVNGSGDMTGSLTGSDGVGSDLMGERFRALFQGGSDAERRLDGRKPSGQEDADFGSKRDPDARRDRRKEERK